MSPSARIDLHAHSTASDGTATPAELVRAAADAGLDVVALTDHDTVAGLAAARDALPDGLTLVPGIELSAYAVEQGRRVPLHLLAYWPREDDVPLVAAMARLREERELRGRRIVERVVAAGLPISWDQVEALAAGGSVGRPHVAQALVDAGVLPDVSAAFTSDWLGSRGRFYVPKEELPVIDAVALVRAAGGVPVFAHPFATHRGATVSTVTIEAMAAAGLAGLEVDHPDHDAAQREHAAHVARRLGLLPTGSSDWHGTRKTTRLGDETTSPEVFAALAVQAVS